MDTQDKSYRSEGKSMDKSEEQDTIYNDDKFEDTVLSPVKPTSSSSSSSSSLSTVTDTKDTLVKGKDTPSTVATDTKTDEESKSAGPSSADVSRSNSRQRGTKDEDESRTTTTNHPGNSPTEITNASSITAATASNKSTTQPSVPSDSSILRMPMLQSMNNNSSSRRQGYLDNNNSTLSSSMFSQSTLASSSASFSNGNVMNIISVGALAGQIYAQFAAPRPTTELSVDQAKQLFPGWLDPDTYRTGLLGMTEKQLLRRLCSGRPEGVSDRIVRVYRAFQHIAAGGQPTEFAPGNPSTDKQQLSVPKICSMDSRTAASVLRCLGRAEGIVRDSIALKRFADFIGEDVPEPVTVSSSVSNNSNSTTTTTTSTASVTVNQDGKTNTPTDKTTGTTDTKQPEGTTVNDKSPTAVPAPSSAATLTTTTKISSSSTTPSTASFGGTVMEFMEVFGYIAEEVVVGSSVRSIASIIRMYSPYNDALSALTAVLEYVSGALENDHDPSYWRIHAASDTFIARLGKINQGTELLRACGFDDLCINNRTLFILDGAHDHKGEPSFPNLPDNLKVRLAQSRAELEIEIEAMEGAPLPSRIFRETETGALHVDNASVLSWTGQLVIAGRMVLRYATNILTNPRDSRLWRINANNAIFMEKVKVLGEPVAARLMSTIGFHRQGDAFVLRGTREYDPASTVVPRYPSESLLMENNMNNIGTTGTGKGDTLPFFNFPNLPEDVLAFLVRRRADIETCLFRLEAKLTRLGSPPPMDNLMNAATIVAAGEKSRDPHAVANNDHPSSSTSTSNAPNPTVPSTAPVPPGGKGTSGKPGTTPAATSTAPTDILLSRANNVPEANLIIPILVRAAVMADPTMESNAQANASATGGGKTPAKKGTTGKPGESGGSSTVVGNDPKFAIHLNQLRLLKQAFTRLDTRGTGIVNVSDLRAAFAAEARPAFERTDQALQAWIRSRDLNNDDAVSWPEFAASFASLFLAPTSASAVSGNAPGKDTKAPPAKPTAKPGTATDPNQAAAQAANEAAQALGTARLALENELTVVATTSVAQLQSVMRASLPPGTLLEQSAPSLLALPWAGPVLDTLAGFGLLLLFCDRFQIRSILTGWTAHITAVVSEPKNTSLWSFRVTMPHEIGVSGQAGIALASSSMSNDFRVGALATMAADSTRTADLTLAWEVARLPGMQLILRGFGYEPIYDNTAAISSSSSSSTSTGTPVLNDSGIHRPRGRGGVPTEYRLGGAASSSWLQLSDSQLAIISACSQVIARHATMFEAIEAADPVAILLAVSTVISGSSLSSVLRKFVTRSGAQAGATGKAAPTANASKTPAKGKPAAIGKGATASSTGPTDTGDPLLDTLFDGTLSETWLGGLETLEKYVTNVCRTPADLSFRRINTNNSVFQTRLANISCPSEMYGLAGPTTLALPTTWAGTRTLTCIGFRETPDGSLVLPPTASLVQLQVRALELSSVLPILRAVIAVSKAKHSATKTLMPLPPSVMNPSSTDTKNDQTNLLHRLPTTLLSSMLDPRIAMSRRYSESNVLRGGDRLAQLSITDGGSMGPHDFLQSQIPIHTGTDGSSSRGSSVPPNEQRLSVSFTQPTTDVHNLSAISHASNVTPTPTVPSTPKTPATATKPGGKGTTSAPTPSAKTGKEKGNTSTTNAEALVGLGPSEAGDAMARILEAAEKTRVESTSKITELEKELAELRAQVRTYQVAELVPKLKQTLAPLTEDPAVRTSAVAAAANLGVKISDITAKSTTHAGTAKGRSPSPGKGKKGDKSKVQSASDKARLTSLPVVIRSPLLTATAVTINDLSVFVQTRPSEMEGGIPPDVEARLNRGEIFVPPQLLLQGGDYIMLGSDIHGEMAFVCKVIDGQDCERSDDQYQLILDRNLSTPQAEGTFISKQNASENDRKQFYRNEMIKFFRNEFLGELFDAAAATAEASLRLREAEGRFLQRTVKRRVPCAVQVYGDVSEAIIPINTKKMNQVPIEPYASLVTACGPQLFILNSHIPPGSAPSSGMPPLTALTTTVTLGGNIGELYSGIYDMVDFGADTVLTLDQVTQRLRNDPTAWATVCSDSSTPTSSVDHKGITNFQPNAHQIWQRLITVPHRMALADNQENNDTLSAPSHSSLTAKDITLTRHLFACLFRPLHTLDFMLTDKTGIRVLTYAHSGKLDVLDEPAVEYWGRQWDIARTTASLLSEQQLNEIVQVFAQIHSREALYTDVAWTTQTSNSVLLLDPKYPLPSELLTIRGAQALFNILDGDAPTEADLFGYAVIAHGERLREAIKARKRLRGEINEEMEKRGFVTEGKMDDDDDDDDDDDEEVDVDGNRLRDRLGRPVPREPWRGLSFADIVTYRTVRDKALIEQGKTLTKATKGSVPLPSSVDTVQLNYRLALERRRLFPTPGLARLPHVRSLLRNAFRDVRKVLVSNILGSFRNNGTTMNVSVGTNETRTLVEERVTSVPVADIIALLQRTDDGRRLLSFPLTLPGAHSVPKGYNSQFITIHSMLEYLGTTSSSGHVTWYQICMAIVSNANSVPVPLEAAPQTVAPAPLLSLPGITEYPPAQHSLVPVAPPTNASHALTVIDTVTNLVTNMIGVLTSDGCLCTYDAYTLTRKWMGRALSPRAARAVQWLRQSRASYAKVLAIPQLSGSTGNSNDLPIDRTNLQNLMNESVSHVLVNRSLATYAVRLANSIDTFHAGLFADATDPDGTTFLEVTWHVDGPSCGQEISHITPRIVTDTELVTFIHPPSSTDPDSPLSSSSFASPQQIITRVAAGTPFALIEYVYIGDAHIVIGTAIPAGEGDQGYKFVWEAESSHQSNNGGGVNGTNPSWPRLLAFDSLTGACIADLGPVGTAASTGTHLVYSAASRHLLAADTMPVLQNIGRLHSVPSPIIKIWDITPIIAVVARQRGSFLQAAISSNTAVAASNTLLATTASFSLNSTNESLGNIDGIGLDELIPAVLTVPHVAVLDIMSQFPQPVRSSSSSSLSSEKRIYKPFASGPSVMDICLLPTSGMLAIAQADGRISLWDAHHRRHRIHYPPTSNFSDDDYNSVNNSHALRPRNKDGYEIDDDPRFTPLSKGCHMATSLKLANFYYPGGILHTAITPLVPNVPYGRLLRDLPTPVLLDTVAENKRVTKSVDSSTGTAAIIPNPSLFIGLAAASGGLGGLFRANRVPSRILVNVDTASRVADIASTYAVILKAHMDAASKKNADAVADAILDTDGEAVAKETSAMQTKNSSGIYAGYVYVLDDGSCIPVEAPATSNGANRSINASLIDLLFDQRLATLADDVYFTAAAASEFSVDGYASLKRAVLSRHRVCRVFYMISKDVPVNSFLPTFTRPTLVGIGTGRTSANNPAVLNIPLATAPLSTIIQTLATAHDAAQGAAGVCTTAAPFIYDLCRPIDEVVSPPLVPVTPPPFVCIPFYSAGDNSTSVMMMRSPGPVPSLPFNGNDSACSGRYWTTGHVVAVGNVTIPVNRTTTTSSSSSSGASETILRQVEVALEYEDRLATVTVQEVEVLETAAGVNLTYDMNATVNMQRREPLPGDRVMVCVRPSMVDATIGPDITRLQAPYQNIENVVFPPSEMLDLPGPGMDILIIHADTVVESSSSLEIENESGIINIPVAKVRRQIMLWAVGRAEADVPVSQLTSSLPLSTVRSMDAGFLRHAYTTLLRSQVRCSSAFASALRRMAVRTTISTQRALALYDAANNGTGVGPTAGALYRAALAVNANEFDPNSVILRSALSYIWSMARLQTEINPISTAQTKAAGDKQIITLERFLVLLVAMAWHYPYFRYALRALFSIGGSGNDGSSSSSSSNGPTRMMGLNGTQMEDTLDSTMMDDTLNPYSEMSASRIQIFRIASACTTVFKRYLLMEAGASSGDLVEEASVILSFANIIDAASNTARENITIDLLLGVLEYLRDAGGMAMEGATDHMINSLIRRRALPWDPAALLSVGFADGTTIDAVTNCLVVPTPLDAFTPGEVSFLLADGPSVAAITESALTGLARAFADPVASMRTTMQTIVFRSNKVHETALLPEDAPLEEISTGMYAPSRVFEHFTADIHALAEVEGDPANQMLGTSLTLLSAHGRLVTLAAALLGDDIIPLHAASMRESLGAYLHRKIAKRNAKLLGRRLSATLALETARKAATAALMTQIHKLLQNAAISVSPEGIDTEWLQRFKNACNDFATLVVAAAQEQSVPNAPDAMIAEMAAQSRAHTQLVRLLSYGALEALVQAASMHTGYAIKIPTVSKPTSGQAIGAVTGAIARILTLLSDDECKPALRISPHVPRLMRSLVYLSTGRLDGIPDDIPADTSAPAPILHPIDTKMIQPAYVAVALASTQPLLLALVGVDGRGSLGFPAVRRYISACGNSGALARGPSLSSSSDSSGLTEAKVLPLGSPLMPLVNSSFLQTYEAYLPGLQRLAVADDAVCKTSIETSTRQVVSWTFEESVEQFAKRYMPLDDGMQPNVNDEDDDEEENSNKSAGNTASGILSMATSGSPHMISSYCSFRRCGTYWRQLIPGLVALEKLHAGMPDPILDIASVDKEISGNGGTGPAVANHARLMDRITFRRHAVSRFRLTMRPPSGLISSTTLLNEDFDEEIARSVGGKGSGGDGADHECEDIDRSLLVTDLQMHDFTAALLLDPDHEVRAIAFRTIRTVSVAVAGSSMEIEGSADLAAELHTSAASTGAASFSARAAIRQWSDLLLRFSQPDVTVAVSRRLLSYLTWVKGGPQLQLSGGKIRHDPPETYEVISHAVDILAAQAAARTALPAAWRMCGVLGILVRLAKMGLPKLPKDKGTDKKKLPSNIASAVKKVNGSTKNGKNSNDEHVPTAESLNRAKALASIDYSYSDIVLHRLCQDHGNEAMLTLAKFDAATRTWASERGLELLTDTTGTWPSVCESLTNALTNLRNKGILEQLAAAASIAEPATRQSFLDGALAQTVSYTLGKLATQAAAIRRAVILEIEQITRGHRSASGLPFSEVINTLWDLCEVGWGVCIGTPPDEPSRSSIHTFIQSILSCLSHAFRRGPIFGCLFLGCPPDDDPAGIPWRGLSFFMRTIAYPVHVRTFDPDGARFIQARMSYLLGDNLTKALDLLILPLSVNVADRIGTQRAMVARRYSLTFVAQAGDAGLVPSFNQYLVNHAKLLSSTLSTGAGAMHIFTGQGQPFALGVRGRSLLWSVILRSIMLTPPRHTNGGPGFPDDMFKVIAVSFTDAMAASSIFRTLINDYLPSIQLLDTAHSGVPPALASYGSTYPLRTEGSTLIYTLGCVFLQVASTEAAQNDADHKGTSTAAKLGKTITNGNSENIDLNTTMVSNTLAQSTLRRQLPSNGLENTPSNPLPMLQEQFSRLLHAEGVILSERKRLWSLRDVAYGPTVAMVLQGILMAVPGDETIRNTLDTVQIPMEAIIWYRAARKLFLATEAQRDDVSVTSTKIRQRYFRAESDAIQAWARWRVGKVGTAPPAREAENARSLAKGLAIPPPVPSGVSATLNMSGRFGASGVNVHQGLGVSTVVSPSSSSFASSMVSPNHFGSTNNNLNVSSLSRSQLDTPSSPPTSPVRSNLVTNNKSNHQSMAALPPPSSVIPPVLPSPIITTFTANASIIQQPVSALRTSTASGGTGRRPSVTGTASASDILSSAARRMKKSVSIQDPSSLLSASITSSVPTPTTIVKPSKDTVASTANQKAAVTATVDAMTRIGEAVVDVKTAFDKIAKTGSPRNELCISATDKVLGTLLRTSFGLPCPFDLLERLSTEGYLSSGNGSVVTFAQLLRIIVRIMELYNLDELKIPDNNENTTPTASNGTKGSSTGSSSTTVTKKFNAGSTGGQVLGSSMIHPHHVIPPPPPAADDASTAFLFKADTVRRLPLPTIPVPSELLRAVFERFSTARVGTGHENNSSNNNNNNPTSPNKSTTSPMVRGIPFSAWTSALAALGMPVTPHEGREVFRYLGLTLAEIADFKTLTKAYIVVGGFRFLVASGIFMPGTDMYQSIQQGMNLSEQNIPMLLLPSMNTDSNNTTDYRVTTVKGSSVEKNPHGSSNGGDITTDDNDDAISDVSDDAINDKDRLDVRDLDGSKIEE